MNAQGMNMKANAIFLPGFLPALRIVMLLAAGLFSMLDASPAAAANGQCKWEGGTGAAGGFAYCELEDCIGNGGLAQCTKPIGGHQGLPESQTEEGNWIYGGCDEQPPHMMWVARWCTAAGGSWVDMGGQNMNCLNLPPDIIGGGGSTTTSAGRLDSVSDTFAGWSCPKTKSGDTGWGATITSYFCGGGSSQYQSGTLTREFRQVTYSYACRSDLTITMMRERSAVCPAPYKSRSYGSSGLQCYLLKDTSCKVSNPVSPLSGTKLQTEVDYRPGAAGGLVFERHYNSAGHYRPAGVTAASLPPAGQADPGDYWRHTYDRRLHAVTGNAGLMAVVQREDGSVRSYDGAGVEQGNASGRAELLEPQSGSEWKLTRADKSIERYDSAGRLKSISTAAGQVTTLSYGTGGTLSTVTDAFGHALQFAYNTAGRLSTVTLPGGGQIQYVHDSFGRMTTVTYPGSVSRQYHYENAKFRWLLTGVTDESSQRFATFTYDTEGRVTASSHAGGADAYSFSYGSATSSTITDPLGASRTLSFTNAKGVYKLSSSTAPGTGCGTVKNSTYDANGNLATRKDFNNNQTSYTFDPVRNLETSRTEAVGTADARTITTQWDAVYRLPAQIDEPGRRTTYTYDANGNQLTRTVTDLATSQSRTWTYTYNLNGQVLTVDGPRSDVNDVTTYTYYECTSGAECGQVATITNAAGHVTTFSVYNAHGQPLTITDANNVSTHLAYDSRQRLTSSDHGGEVTEMTYYPTGLLKRVTVPDGSYVEHTYDAAHRLTRIDDGEGNHIVYTLDAAGNRTAENVYDPSNILARTRGWIYDTLGRTTSELDASNQAVTYTHDLNGNTESSVDRGGRLTTFGYDARNRQVSVVDPVLSLTQYGYTNLDELASVTDPRALNTQYAYNAFGEVTTLTSPDTGVTTYSRNAAGLQQSTDARSKTATYSYDALGRPTQVVYSDQTLQFTYDQNLNGVGRLTQMTDGSGATHWTYTQQGRIATKQQVVGPRTFNVGYGYNLAGNLNQLTTPSGQVVGYSYSNGRISGITINGSPLLSGVLYAPFGQTRGWNWANGTLAVREYDSDGRITTVDSAGLATYSYYPDGTISSRTTDEPALAAVNDGLTTFDVSLSSNRLVSSAGANVRSYSYDSSGNITSDGTRTFTYNSAGRMVSATSGGVTTTYALNGIGQRVSKTASAQSTYFAYDEAGHLLGEYSNSGALIQETVWFGEIPVAVLKPNGSGGINVFYVHTDHLDAPRRVSRPSDNVVLWRWNSDPFGAIPANQDADGDSIAFAYNLRFPGQYFDPENELHYNYFRSYDPTTGRYTTSDPIGLAGGINTYAYAASYPIGLFDAFGLDAADVGTVLGCGIGGGIGSTIGGTGGAAGGLLCGPGAVACSPAGAAAGAAAGGMLGCAGGAVVGRSIGKFIDKICSDDPDECAKIEAAIAALASELRSRYLMAQLDPNNLYERARVKRVSRRGGSYLGHRQQFLEKQATLRELIAAADASGCKVAFEDRLLSSAPYPDMPVGR